MQQLNLPAFKVRCKRSKDTIYIHDPLRRLYLKLSPEEWVRQHFVNFLINYKNVPSTLIANEVGINLNGTIKRCDSIIYDQYLNPLAIVEYKAPNIAINEKVLDQIVRYNMTLRAKYLLLSNGLNHYCCLIDYQKQTYSFLPEIPMYQDL